MTTEKENAAALIDYHERTKHRFDGYAEGPHSIDWDAQPDVFRRYEGAPRRKLPLQDKDAGSSYAALFAAQQPGAEPWDEAGLSRLLQFSLGLSAWKQYGTSRWSLRCNPSSGNLHPTEAYLIMRGIQDFADGVYHYLPEQHALEQRALYPEKHESGAARLLLALSSVHWREAWKYGERAYRYCQLDVGHALAALSYAAAAVGYQITPLWELSTDTLQSVLGLDRAEEFYADEAEQADVLLLLHPSGSPADVSLAALPALSAEAVWQGRAQRLDRRHFYTWPLIEEAAAACRRPAGSVESLAAETWPDPAAPADHPLTRQSAARLFQQRRSAQGFNPAGGMEQEDFFRLLDRLLPRPQLPPWSAQHWPARLHLLLFIHDVNGLAPGLYFMARRRAALDALKAAMRDDLLWESVAEAPPHLPLYCLARANARKAAMRLSCMQAIAGDSAFSLGMLGEFEEAVTQAPWVYNELYWEAGMAGQVLYLEAEAVGLRGTGIGCFFDDGVHEMLGIQSKVLQSMYHFTVGLPLEDTRLITLPPYHS